ncbi:hypothetical protein GCM10007940_29680 [Portibacter lacus]|uniref:DUF4249 family protein n=1 Tax=Portibacter lacus TaxID=1099794 RepID=A0AA37SR45_9BACT|nr:hypothetical protein GCM10007940_29680 [Portibacter lacus]
MNLDFSNTDKKLIINGRFAANKTFKIALTTSRNILDPESKIERVSDAYVAIKNDEGKILEVLQEYNNLGLYVSTDSLKAYQGNTYHLEVTHPNWSGTVFTASSSAPEISNMSIIDTNHVFIDNAPALKVGVLIDDLHNLNDKYVFEVELKEKGVLAQLMIENPDEKDVKIFGDKMSPTRLFLGDANFNGSQKNLDFFTKQGIPNDTSQVAGKGITEIRMMNVSQELYNYYKSLEEYQLAQKTIGSGNSSAVRVFSNIKRSGVDNGLGIFAGYNVKSLTYTY